MAKFNFNLREPNASSKTPIHLIVRWNNNRMVYPTVESIEPKHWEKEKQRVSSKFKQSPELNNRLKYIDTTSNDIFRRFVNDNKRTPSVSELRTSFDKELNPDKEKKLDFFGYFEKFIDESKLKTSSKTKSLYSVNTIKNYRNTLTHLRDYSKSKNRKIDFDTIDLDFYHELIEYLTNVKDFSENTKGRIIKIIKTVLNDATERDVNTNLSFKSKRFRVMSEDVENIYLDENEIKEMYNLDLTKNERLEKVRDLFIVGCYTGLRFGDLSTISKSNIKGNRLHFKVLKTAKPLVIPLNLTVMNILEKYKGNFPKAISNQKMNKYLKEIGKLVKILNNKTEISITKGGLTIIENKKKYEVLSCHTARRSFATNCYLNRVPSISIMKITGHKTESSFMKYIKITPDDNAEILEMYLNKNQSLKIVS